MKLAACRGIDEFVELRFKAGSWEAQGVPESGCHVRQGVLEDIIANGGAVSPDDLICGLMDWLDVTDEPLPSLALLRRMLDLHYPDDGKPHARCMFAEPEGPPLVFHIERAMDLALPIIAWQRRGWVIATACAHPEEGRVAIGAPAPVSLKVAQGILSHAPLTYMTEQFDSFESLRSASGKAASILSWVAGEPTVVSWDRGLGMIAASKARGMWMGGTPPLGYRPDGRSLAIVESEAKGDHFNQSRACSPAIS